MLSEKYKLETVVKEPTVIYMERPLKAASHTIHIEVPPNPVLGIHRTVCYTTPAWLRCTIREPGFAGILEPEFSNAVRDGIRYGLEQGLFGWNVTDCKICFEYGLYYSPSARPADFRSLGPDCIGTGIEGNQGRNCWNLISPSPSMRPGNIFPGLIMMHRNTVPPSKRSQVKKDEVVFTGEIPARCIQAYRTDLAFYTNGQSVCLTELKGYQAAVGKPVIQPRRPNSRLDKVRYMFQKIM